MQSRLNIIIFFYLVFCKCEFSKDILKTPGKQQKHKKHRLSAPDSHVKYGINLPAFSFDYSEYISGAVIERSFLRDDFHLNVFMIEHSAMEFDSTISAVSTDEDVLYSWGRATEKWSTMTKPHLIHTTAASGLMCVMHNNDGHHAPYQVNAHWVYVDLTDDDSGSGYYKHGLKILRCRIKGTDSDLLKNANTYDNKKLFVDVIRKTSKHTTALNSKHSTLNTTTAWTPTHETSSTTSSSSNNSTTSMSSDPSSILISFNVPWQSRQTGFPMRFDVNASRFDPWSNAHHVTREGGRGVYICVSGLRPLNPYRAEVGIPMLLEFVQHHILLGVKHIFLGLQVDRNSVAMYKHLQLLQPYIQSGHVSVSSMSLPNVDDAAGFGGLHLHDSYADLFSLNQCLYLLKGMADYVIVMRASDFIVPTTMFTTANGNSLESSNILGTVFSETVSSPSNITQAKQHSTVNMGDQTRLLSATSDSVQGAITSHRRHKDRHSTVNRSELISNLFANTRTKLKYDPESNLDLNASVASSGSLPHKEVVCSLYLHGYGVSDPSDAFASWGPGDDAWTSDYFKKSTPIALSSMYKSSIVVIPTKYAVAIDITRVGNSPRGLCSNIAASMHMATGVDMPMMSGAHGNTSRSFLKGPRLQNSVNKVGIKFIQRTVSSDKAVTYSYRESFSTDTIQSSSDTGNDIDSHLHSNHSQILTILQREVKDKLSSQGFTTIKDVKQLIKQSVTDFKTSTLYTETLLTNNGGNGKRKEIRTRSSMKPPFWLPCSGTTNSSTTGVSGVGRFREALSKAYSR